MSSIDELLFQYGINHVSDTFLNSSRFPGSRLIFAVFVEYFFIRIEFPSRNNDGWSVTFLARYRFIKYGSDSSSKHDFCR